MTNDLKPKLRLAYYGDDFTGSTDVLEALSLGGVPAALFLEAPSTETLTRNPELSAIGVAGLSRSMSPTEMAEQLPPIFETLRALNPAVVHYKICSTFDSSPTLGSIGRAIELGQRTFQRQMVPLVVGAPVLGRYCVFGNLFARSGGDSAIYRLDRHPTMACHPSTPMDEADLLCHLARQTDTPMRLMNVLELDLPGHDLDEVIAERVGDEQPIVLFDTLTNAHLQSIGRVIWDRAQLTSSLFTVGSSGVEYALLSHWRATGEQPAVAAPTMAEPVDQVLAVSGSCSPVTARQIARAEQAGFATLALQPEHLLPMAGDHTKVLEAPLKAARQLLREGRSVILHSCTGPSDPRLNKVRQRMKDREASEGDSVQPNRVIAAQLGSLLSQLVEHVDLQRVVVTGGDTSGYVAQSLGIDFVRFVAPIAPGSPLCKAEAPGHAIHGREVVFKGGQVGKDDFFLSVLSGQA